MGEIEYKNKTYVFTNKQELEEVTATIKQLFYDEVERLSAIDGHPHIETDIAALDTEYANVITQLEMDAFRYDRT